MKIKSFFLLTFLSLSLLAKAQCFPVDTLKLNTTYRLLEKNPGNEELKKQFLIHFLTLGAILSRRTDILLKKDMTFLCILW